MMTMTKTEKPGQDAKEAIVEKCFSDGAGKPMRMRKKRCEARRWMGVNKNKKQAWKDFMGLLLLCRDRTTNSKRKKNKPNVDKGGS